MGTRSLTVFKDGEHEIAVMYRQMDGYPSGHGADLAEFLSGMRVVNGLSAFGDNSKTANGMDCLAAQVVAYFKTGPGGIYLMSAGTRECGEEYIYWVSDNEDGSIQLVITTHNPMEVLFDGSAQDFAQYLQDNPDA